MPSWYRNIKCKRFPSKSNPKATWAVLVLLHMATTSGTSSSLAYEISFPKAEVLSAHTVRVPFRMAGNLVLLESQIGNVKGNVLLDTGSKRLLLNSNHFQGQSLSRGLLAYGQTGIVEEVATKKVDSLGWNGFLLGKLQAHVLDLTHIEHQKRIRLIGILGFEVLEPFEVFVDYHLQQITLIRLDKAGNKMDSVGILETPEDSLSFNRKGHMIVLKGVSNGIRLKLGLDTGAEINILDPKVIRKVKANFEVTKRTLLRGAGKKEIEVLAGRFYRLQVGHIRCGPLMTLASKMDDLNKIVVGTSLDGILGFPFLSGKRMLINYRKRKLYFFKKYGP